MNTDPIDRNLLSEHDRKIGALETSITSTNERLDDVSRGVNDLRQDLKAAFRDITKEIREDRREEQSTRKPQYGILVSLMSLVLAASVSFAALTNNPQDARIGKVEDAIVSSIEREISALDRERSGERELGGLSSNIESLRAFQIDLEQDQETIERGVSNNLDRLAKLEGIVDNLKELIQDVDAHGSRKWVDKGL